MHQALAKERSHQMGLESLGPGAKRLILATLQDILKIRNDPLLYSQIVAVCLGKKVHCWRDLFASQFERCHCFVIYSWDEEWGEPIPTAYSYGYLWAAHTLFYWHRDQDMVWASLSKSFK